jgi:hypothetical protein
MADDRDFGWVELKADGGPGLPREDLAFRVFFVQVKSDTELGHFLHDDPLSFFRKNIPEMQISDEADDVRAVSLRVNAERPSNPRHRSEVWAVIPGSTTVAGLQYKHPNDED